MYNALALAVAMTTAQGAAPGSLPTDRNRGHAVYEQYCASCHGAKAQGAPDWQHRNALGEMPAPPHDATGHTWRHSDTMLFSMISKGLRDPFNKTPRLTMPPFEHVLSPGQIKAVIVYLKTLWTPEERAFQAEETRDSTAPDP